MTKETQSATDAASVDVSSNDVTLDRTSRAIWVGTLGDLEVVTEQGSTVVFKQAQGVVPIQATQVLNANTTAADILALF